MQTQITSRVLALGTIAGLFFAGAASWVFGTFSSSIISGQSCSGYGYFAGYGYGYDCVVVSGGGWGGWGGGSSSTPTPTPTPTNTGTTNSGTNQTPTPTPTPNPTPVIFPEYTKTCVDEITDLTDPRLADYYTELGVTNTSNPNRKLTRAEFLKLVLNAAHIDVSLEPSPTYSDVPATHPMAKYISYATRAGIVSGQNGRFRPNDLISRAEAAKVLIRGIGVTLSTQVNTFADVGSNNTLGRYIETAYDNCILHGRRTIGGETTLTSGARIFEPADGITLAETAKVLYNINH